MRTRIVRTRIVRGFVVFHVLDRTEFDALLLAADTAEQNEWDSFNRDLSGDVGEFCAKLRKHGLPLANGGVFPMAIAARFNVVDVLGSYLQTIQDNPDWTSEDSTQAEANGNAATLLLNRISNVEDDCNPDVI